MTGDCTGPESEAFFLPGNKGDLFSLYYPPSTAAPARGGVLLFPAFAEEMNRTRHQVSLQARRLAKLGYGVLSVDLHGTGDSQGDFGEADWELWVEDMLTALRWLMERAGQPLSLLGVRSGCLLALEVLRRQNLSPVDKIVFWQPVVNGENFMNQFLRLRMAADLVAAGEGIGTKETKASLQAGESVEIAGYRLSPALYQSLVVQDFNRHAGLDTGLIHWLETVPAPERPIGMASRRVIESEAWQERVRLYRITGEPFWATPEISIVPALLDQTSEIFGGGDD